MGLVHRIASIKTSDVKRRCSDPYETTGKRNRQYGGQSTDGFGSCRERSGCRDDAVKQKGKGKYWTSLRSMHVQTLPGSGFSDIAGKWLRRAERR